MDRDRFQPWFFNYPSGLDLEFVGDALNGAIQWLHDRYRFDCFFVTAHSMGGLVARYAILQNVYEDGRDYICLLVTISTPWGSHQAATQGVKYAPAVVPRWRNMVPGSAFISDLYRRPLPAEVPHYLLFSYSGRSGIMEANNDGAVTLESQLDYRVQHQVEGLYGFDENHVAVLFSDDRVERFNAVLHERAAVLPNRTWRSMMDGIGFSPSAPSGALEKTASPRDWH